MKTEKITLKSGESSENLDNTLRLKEQADEILRIASEHGVEQNFFFLTTFKRYQVQIKILDDLEETINNEGPIVTKEYVKGRGNVYTHPAIAEYNKTSTAANSTVDTLVRIMEKLSEEPVKESKLYKLMEAMGGD